MSDETGCLVVALIGGGLVLITCISLLIGTIQAL